MRAITVDHVYKNYKRRDGKRGMEVLADIHLTITQGEFLVLLGPSGCGKSTLLRIMAGLIPPTRGTVSFGASGGSAAGLEEKKSAGHTPSPQKNIGFVFQNFGLLPWLTVRKNIELNLIGKNIDAAIREKEVDAIMTRFGLHRFADHHPHELSGGMRQRVGIARAFVAKPDIIFLDEPFSELDFFTAESLRNELLTLWRERGATVVMVSHYIDEAVALADRIAVFSDRPGSIIKIIENTLARPRNRRTPEFFALEDSIMDHFAQDHLA